jgi:hypothetical protein
MTSVIAFNSIRRRLDRLSTVLTHYYMMIRFLTKLDLHRQRLWVSNQAKNMTLGGVKLRPTNLNEGCIVPSLVQVL